MEGGLRQSLATHENGRFLFVAQHTAVTNVRLDLSESCVRPRITVGANRQKWHKLQGVFHHDLLMLRPNLFALSPLQNLAMNEGLLCGRTGGGGESLPSGFLWICLNMLLYQSLGLFTLYGGGQRGWESTEGKHIFRFAFLDLKSA